MNENLDYQAYQEHAFAIVDASMMEELPAGLVMETLAPKELVSSSHLLPKLIDLRRTPRDRSEELFAFLCDVSPASQSLRAVVLIQTHANAAAQIRHWNAMQLATPAPGRRLWLRLHDPRVLHQLLRILSPAQRKKMFGVAKAFTYWVGGAWVCAPREIPDQADTHVQMSSVGPPFAGAFMWDWERIERIGMVNRALLGAAIFDAAALYSKGFLVEQLFDRAVTYSLVDQADLVEFAIRGLIIHPAFDRHPEVVRAINPFCDTESRLADRLALIPDHIWNGMRQSTTMDGECENDHTK